MRASPIVMCCWPGLPRLWLCGDWFSLLVALAFGVVLNLLLVSAWVRPDWLPWPANGLAWLLVGGFWFAYWRRPRWLERRAVLVAVVASGPLAFLAVEAGWTVTEVGRQPWIVYGLVRTSAAITGSPLVGLMFALFTLLYAVLSAVTVLALGSELRLLPRRALAGLRPAE